MKILPTSETQAEKIIREISGRPQEKSLCDFLQKEKQYVNMPDLSEQGFKLSWSLGRHIIDATLQELWGGKFGVYKTGMLWLPDQRLGRTRAIFHYKENEDLYLDYTPEFLRWGCIEEQPRKNILLQKNEKDLRLPYGFYLLRD